MSRTDAPTRTKLLVILIGALALVSAIVAVVILSIPQPSTAAATLPTSDMLTGTYDWGEFGGEQPALAIVTVDENGCFTTRGFSDASPEPMLILWPSGAEKSDDSHVVSGDKVYGHGSELPYFVATISAAQAIEASEGRHAELEQMLVDCELDHSGAMVGVLMEQRVGL